jgi:hypothetical protein
LFCYFLYKLYSEAVAIRNTYNYKSRKKIRNLLCIEGIYNYCFYHQHFIMEQLLELNNLMYACNATNEQVTGNKKWF